MHRRRAERQNWALPFFAGLFAGIVCVYCNRSYLISENGFLGKSGLERIGRMELNQNVFFFYVLWKRLGFVWLSSVLATTFAGIAALYLLVLWAGFGGGIAAAAAVLRYGIKGFLLLAGGTLPQFLLYVPAFCMLTKWCCRMCVQLYGSENAYAEEDFEKQKKTRLLAGLLQIHAVVIIGVFLESYVNPELMAELLKIF